MWSAHSEYNSRNVWIVLACCQCYRRSGLPVCLSVGHVLEPYKNDMNRSRCRLKGRLSWVQGTMHCIGIKILPQKWEILGFVRPIGSIGSQCCAAKINKSYSGIAAAECNVPDWSAITLSPLKNLPAMRPFFKILWPPVYLLTYLLPYSIYCV